MSLPRHPDTITGLAPDCRRILLAEYQVIQARMATPDRQVRWEAGIPVKETSAEARARVDGERGGSVDDAISEYRRVARLWGIDVD